MSIKRDTEFRRRLPVHSFLQAFPVIYDTSDRERFINVFRSVSKREDVQESFMFEEFIVQEDDWLDLISARYYGTPNLWWLVAILNDITNPFECLDEGTSVKLLKNMYLFMIYDSLYEIGML